MDNGYHENRRAHKGLPVQALLVGGLSGVLLALAYPTQNLWPLAVLAWVPLLAWMERMRPGWRLGLLAGWTMGAVMFAWLFSFLAYTMREMSGMPAFVGWLVVALHALAAGVHQALVAAGLAWTARMDTGPLRRALQAASLLVVVEFAVPWLFRFYLGNALWRAPALLQVADVVGVVGVGGAAIAVSMLLARALVGPSGRVRALVGALVLVSLWAGYGVWRLETIAATPVQRTWNALMIQHNATVAEKRASAVRERLPMLDRLESLTRRAQAMGQLRNVDAVIWPEGALPFFWVVDDVTPNVPNLPKGSTRAGPHHLAMKQRLLALQAELGVPLLTGTQRRTTQKWTDDGRNGAVLLELGRQRWVYDKRILLAFGEYLPGAQWIPALRGAIPGVTQFESGSTSGLVTLGGTLALVNICYEALFGEFLRDEAADAAVLVNLTNDVWFGPPPAGELHLMVQQARAVELRRPLVRSTVSGISAWVDAAGGVHQATDVASEAVVRAEVPLRDLESPWRVWGTWPLWLWTLATVGWLMSVARRSRRARTEVLDKAAGSWPNTAPATKEPT